VYKVEGLPRREVMLMFDFKDLMEFGMLIIALLAFIYSMIKK